MPPEPAATWQCSCGRKVPARFDQCHCGITRDQQSRATGSDDVATKEMSLLGLALRAGAVAAVAVLASGWFLASRPTKGQAAPAPVVASAPPPVAPVASATPTPATLPHWVPPPAGFTDRAPPQEPPYSGDADTEAGRSIPPDTPNDAPRADEGPSEMDRLRAKTEMWRARYRPVAERIAELEKEIQRLEALATKVGSVPYEENNPSKNSQIKLEGDYVHGRLASARRELEQARRELSDVEEAAHRDGVPSGQLY